MDYKRRKLPLPYLLVEFTPNHVKVVNHPQFAANVRNLIEN